MHRFMVWQLLEGKKQIAQLQTSDGSLNWLAACYDERERRKALFIVYTADIVKQINNYSYHSYAILMMTYKFMCMRTKTTKVNSVILKLNETIIKLRWIH